MHTFVKPSHTHTHNKRKTVLPVTHEKLVFNLLGLVGGRLRFHRTGKGTRRPVRKMSNSRPECA